MRRTEIKEHEVIKKHRNYQRYIVILICLSAFVAAVVTVSLIKPAVTMTHSCGMEEHIHDESCYELVCTQTTEEDGSEHVHSIEKGCYDTEDPICGMEEHIHGPECELAEDTEEQEQQYDAYEVTESEPAEPAADIEETTEPEDDEVIVAEEQTASAKMGREIEAYDGEPVDFSDYIQSITFTDDSPGVVKNGSFNGISSSNTKGFVVNSDGGVDSKKGDFVLKYEFEYENLGAGNKQIYCILPDDLKLTGGWGINPDTYTETGDVTKGGSVIGSYAFVKHVGYDDPCDAGKKLIITFKDSFLVGLQDDSKITGEMKFEGYVLKTNNGTSSETVQIGSAQAVVPFNDLSAKKTVVSADNSKVSYSVEISSKYGTGDGVLSFNDVLSGSDIALDADSFTVKKGGAEVSSYTKTISNDRKSADITGLPALGMGESYVIEYTATPDLSTATSVNYGNTATVTNGTYTSTSTAGGILYNGFEIDKYGSYDNRIKVITWTVKVINHNREDLKDYTVSDNMLASAIEGSLSIHTDEWNQNSDNDVISLFTKNGANLTFKGEAKAEYYVIKYKTKVEDSQIGTELTNTSDLKIDETIAATDTEKLTPTDRKDIQKYNKGKTADALGNYTLNWEANFNFQEGDFNIAITDTMTGTEHYMTKAQVEAIEVTGSYLGSDGNWHENDPLTKGADYNIKCYDHGGAEISSVTDASRVSKYEIEFTNADIPSRCYDIKAVYSSTVDMSGVASGSSLNVSNKAEFSDISKESQLTLTKDKPFVKYDALANSTGETTHDLAELHEDSEGYYHLEWYIDANTAGYYDDSTEANLVDTLPDDVIFEEDSVVVKDSSDAVGVKDTDYTVSQSGQVVTFTVKSSFHQGTEFKIYYKAKFTEETYLQDVDHGHSVVVQFVNKVSDELGKNTVTQTQDVTHEFIKKTATTKDNSYQGYVDYTLDINEEAVDLDPGRDSLTIEDIVDLGKQREGSSAEDPYVWNSFYAVFQYVDSIVGVDVNGNEYDLPSGTYSLDKCENIEYEENWCPYLKAKLSFTIPDGKHVRIKYRYHFVHNNPSETADVTVNNTATVTFNGVSQSATHHEAYDLNKTSSGTADTSHRLKIRKVKQGNLLTTLAGAEFELTVFNSGIWDAVVENGSNTFTTGSDGFVQLPVLEKNKLYRLVETKPPSGYKLESTPYYFAIESTISGGVLSGAGVGLANVHSLRDSDVITIENEPGGARLPATGGSGTAIFIVAGGIIMLGAAAGIVFLTFRRRRLAKADKADGSEKNPK